MEKGEGRPKRVERIEVDEPRLREMVKAIRAALEAPTGLSLFETFQEVDPVANRLKAVDEGRYLFRASEASVTPEAAGAVFQGILECLREQIADRESEWSAIEAGVSGETGRFLERVLRNDGRHLVENARKWGVAPESLALVCLLWARPFRREAAGRLLEGIGTETWAMGFCPVCGHWPTFGYLPAEGEKRILRCGACTTTWAFARIRCPFCLAEDAEKLAYITVDNNEALPVYVCEECKRYLKHRREERGATGDAEADYFLTAPLDYVATNQGYIQESLITVRFDEPDGEPVRAYRAKATYQGGPSGPDEVH